MKKARLLLHKVFPGPAFKDARANARRLANEGAIEELISYLALWLRLEGRDDLTPRDFAVLWDARKVAILVTKAQGICEAKGAS